MRCVGCSTCLNFYPVASLCRIKGGGEVRESDICMGESRQGEVRSSSSFLEEVLTRGHTNS